MAVRGIFEELAVLGPLGDDCYIICSNASILSNNRGQVPFLISIVWLFLVLVSEK